MTADSTPQTTETAHPGYRAPKDLSLFGAEHVRRYRETGGAVGHDWNGAPCLVLTTRGRRSGEPRDTPLIYARDGERLIVIASNGGADRHPAWFLNLAADPHVEVQVRDRRFRAVARAAEGGERERLWRRAVEVWPNYDEYTRRTGRTIPLVVLEPADG